ncbi:substrate-binding domain-containing protein [Paraburkholderia acidiphila]|uniref:Solute-binding protein n=1 Tax=Paraburkholderia acidiphila TaxID=2571747 RepID=A0A7Z2JD64_9BURK|nr:substrate-binding domain-containing protein [Paraburkholderia acidiphila]QGZ58745.1 solute-binding protein [Paraburkholderia acidiphila]
MTIHKLRLCILAFCVSLALLGPCACLADPVKVMMSGWFAPAYRELGPLFEDETGNTLVTVWGAAAGTALTAIPVRFARGEWADVLIVVSYALDDQIHAGNVVPGSKVDFARSPIGMVVREGAPKPDISSVDALRRTLLEAKSIVFPQNASGAYIANELFSRLGIEGRVKSKSRMVPADRVATVVANGDAQIGFQQVVELLPVKGVTVVGSLPAELQNYVVYSGGVATTAKNPAGAEALIRFLSSPDAAPAIMRSGLEPITAPQPQLPLPLQPPQQQQPQTPQQSN